MARANWTKNAIQFSKISGEWLIPCGNEVSGFVGILGAITANIGLPGPLSLEATQLLVYARQADGNQITRIREQVPTSVNLNNPSLAMTWVGTHVTQVRATIGGIVYTKNLTWVGDTITAVSAWV